MESKGIPVVPCGCSLRTGTVRRNLRDTIADWEKEFPHIRETMLTAMGRVEHGRLLDRRYLDLDGTSTPGEDEEEMGGSALLPILVNA